MHVIMSIDNKTRAKIKIFKDRVIKLNDEHSFCSLIYYVSEQ